MLCPVSPARLSIYTAVAAGKEISQLRRSSKVRIGTVKSLAFAEEEVIFARKATKERERRAKRKRRKE